MERKRKTSGTWKYKCVLLSYVWCLILNTILPYCFQNRMEVYIFKSVLENSCTFVFIEIEQVYG